MWHISKGRSRTVIAIPSLRVVIKCARIRKRPFEGFYADMSFAYREMFPNPDPKVRKIFWEVVRASASRAFIEFFEGFASNWRERAYYKRTNTLHRLFLQPTYFSLFGIFNIQKLGKPMDEARSDEMYRRFHAVAGEALIRDGHHWTFANNFHLASDGPKILDYGSVDTQRIIDEYGVDLYTRFGTK